MIFGHNQNEANEAIASRLKQRQANEADTDTDIDTDTENETVTERDCKGRT